MPRVPAQADWRSFLTGMGLDAAGYGGSRTQSSGRLTEITGFGSNPGGLRMFSYAPDDLPAGSPLVVVLHGCGQDAAGYDQGAGWSTLADRLGFAVLAPEQIASNNANGCFSWFRPSDTRRDQGEAASIRQMIARMVAERRLDPKRIFVTGLSAGGAMTSVMLATYPEVFAGGAIIAGLPYGAAASVQEALGSMRQPPARSPRAWGDLVRDASSHPGPWPRVSVWHGDADATVSSANAEAIIAQWSDLQGLPTAPASRDVVNGYPRRSWVDAGGRPVLESYTITGLAHGTPILSGEGEEASGSARPFILEAGIPSSYRIAQFWGLAHSRPAATGAPGRKAAAASSDPRDRPASLLTPGRLDPQATITQALKAAGLFKRL